MSLSLYVLHSSQSMTIRVTLSQFFRRSGSSQGRIKGGQRGQLPRAPRCKGAPRDEIYLFQVKYSVEKFS